MVLFCGGVVCLCSLDFGGKGAEVYFSVIELDSGFPLFLSSVPFKSFVFRAGFRFSPGAVAKVLRNGCGTEISLSIVKTAAVYVVADHVFWNVNNLPMHPDSFSGVFVFDPVPAYCV